MATIYYIDSENVGDGWIELLEDTNSKFLVFYTGHSPRIAYPQAIKLMNATNKPEFIECYEGNNGLDFQLVSYLGYELHADNSNEMIIVSKDTGFDTVVHFWTQRGMNVKRIPLTNSVNSQPKPKEEPVSDGEVVIDLSSVEVEEKIYDVNRSELNTIINCVGDLNTSYIHLFLIQFYGNKKGLCIYKWLKKEAFVAPPVSWTKEMRIKKLIELIVRYCNTQNISVPPNFSNYIFHNAVEDKKALSKQILLDYGCEGVELNKMFKPFYKALAKIK